MNEDQHIRELLQQKLQGAESPVDPGIWSQLSQQLPTSGAAGSAGASGAAASSGGFGAVAAVIGTIVVAGAIAVGIYLNDPQEDASAETPIVTEEQSTSGTELSEDQKTPSVNSEESTEKPIQTTKLPAEPKPAKKESQKIKDDLDPLVDTLTVETIYESEPTPGTSDQPSTHQETSMQPDASQNASYEQETPVQPDEDLTGDFTVKAYDRESLTRLFEPAYYDGVQYIWFFGDGEMSNERIPQHTYELEDDYTVILEVVDENGFSKISEQRISVRLPAKLVLANVFTPNNDGQNDRLYIHPSSRKIQVEEMVVYDSNGNVMFSQSGEGSGWDGTDPAGNQCAQGQYIFVVVARSDDGKVYNEKRIVHLLR